jgi:hypothetical protein
MHTRFGGRQRPDLKLARWILLGADGNALAAPPVPQLAAVSPQAQLDQFAKPVEPQSRVRTVEEPSLGEQMGGDSVPW